MTEEVPNLPKTCYNSLEKGMKLFSSEPDYFLLALHHKTEEQTKSLEWFRNPTKLLDYETIPQFAETEKYQEAQSLRIAR